MKASSSISSHSTSEISSFTSISAFGTTWYQLTAMAKDNGKCGDCDCAAGTCAKENGGKCGNCDCPAGTCANENGGKCGDCDCAAGTCAKE